MKKVDRRLKDKLVSKMRAETLSQEEAHQTDDSVIAMLDYYQFMTFLRLCTPEVSTEIRDRFEAKYKVKVSDPHTENRIDGILTVSSKYR